MGTNPFRYACNDPDHVVRPMIPYPVWAVLDDYAKENKLSFREAVALAAESLTGVKVCEYPIPFNVV